MKKVGDEETMVVLGFAMKAKTRSACVETILVCMVNSESHGTGI